MKKNVIGLVLVIVASVLSGYAQTNKPYVSKEGKFSVTLPAGFEKFDYSKKPTPSDAGNIDMNQYSVTLDGATYMVIYYDYPESVFKAKTIDEILSDSVSGFSKKLNSAISNQKNITVDGFQAVSFDTSITVDKFTFYGHTVWVAAKPRLYSYMFLSSDKAPLTNPDAAKFFDSFHIQK